MPLHSNSSSCRLSCLGGSAHCFTSDQGACYSPQQGAYTGTYMYYQDACYSPQQSSYASGYNQSLYCDAITPRASLQVSNSSDSQNPPTCERIKRKESANYYPSSNVDKTKLKTPEFIIAKYRSLRVESKAGMLAIKLAKGAFSGENVLAECTVSGFRDLPFEELNSLKQTLFQQFPNYWATLEEFEGVWERATESIGQCAKGVRTKKAASTFWCVGWSFLYIMHTSTYTYLVLEDAHLCRLELSLYNAHQYIHIPCSSRCTPVLTCSCSDIFVITIKIELIMIM